MTSRTSDRRAAALMAVDARFHLHTEPQRDRIGSPHVAVTGIAGHLLFMPRMAEEHKVRQLVQRLLRHDSSVLRHSREALNRIRVLRCLLMAHHAFGRGW